MKTVYQSVAVSAYQYEGYIGVYVVNDMPPSSSFEYTLVVQAVSWQTVREYTGVGTLEISGGICNTAGFLQRDSWRKDTNIITSKTQAFSLQQLRWTHTRMHKLEQYGNILWRWGIATVYMLINYVGPVEKMITRGGSMPLLSST